MKRLKIYPKTFFYTLGLLLFIVLVAHALLYFLTPQVPLDLSSGPGSGDVVLTGKFNLTPYITQMILQVLPISLFCCVLISILCSLLFSKQITVPIKQISAVTERMARMDKTAACRIHAKDEIGMLADNINSLYQTLLATIDNLEIEKQRVREMEQSKVDFMRAASHELKTPLTALSATLENMILGIGKYRNVEAYLPQCKEMTEQLTGMIQEILEASKLGGPAKNEEPVKTDLSSLLARLCAPYEQIAKARGTQFKLDLSGGFIAKLPPRTFGKAVSNVLANAVTYTEEGKTVSVYFEHYTLVVENECMPIPPEALRHIFEPFYRPDYARNRDDGGNGLGLYLVDMLLKAMKLSYSFRPMEQPPGMRFVIYLQGGKENFKEDSLFDNEIGTNGSS